MRSLLLAGVAVAALAFAPVQAQQLSREAGPVAAEASIDTRNGFARLLLTFPTDMDAQVKSSGTVLVVSFASPVILSPERLIAQSNGYISAARVDPDGRGLRLALARKVRVNAMAAGTKLFIDLLPESFTGLPPGLPQEVAEELAKRARDAEKTARQREIAERMRNAPPVRVRIGTAPTFTRYVFELPQPVNARTDREGDTVQVTFEAPLNIDLAPVRAALPSSIMSIESVNNGQTTTVSLALTAGTDTRSFREDLHFVIDVTPKDEAASAEPSPRNAPRASANGAIPVPVPRPREPASAPLPTNRPEELAAVEPTPSAPVPPAATTPAATTPATTTPATTTPAGTTPGAPQASAAPVAAPVVVPPAAPVPGAVAVSLARQGDVLRIVLPFTEATSGAVFKRVDAIWIVLDTDKPIDVSALAADASQTIRSATLTTSGKGQVVRLQLERPRLLSHATDGTSWVVSLGDSVLEQPRALAVRRTSGSGMPTSVSLGLDAARHVYRLTDPVIGDTLLVATALPPARGIVRSQDFVDFNVLATTHGVAVQALADELDMVAQPDAVVVTRAGGLTLSSANVPARRAGVARVDALDPLAWGFDRQAEFRVRESELLARAAGASDAQRTTLRIELARFYLAHGRGAEARGVVEMIMAQDHAAAGDLSLHMLRAIALLTQGRADDALKEFSRPDLGANPEAALWRGLALVRLGNFGTAYQSFAAGEAALARMPVELQRTILLAAIHAASKAGEFDAAQRYFADLDVIGVTAEMGGELSLLAGILKEGQGETTAALADFRAAADAGTGAVQAEARFRAIQLGRSSGQMDLDTAITELDRLTYAWRGDRIELAARQLLGQWHADANRFRDSFLQLRAAMAIDPNNEITRAMQDRAAQVFEGLYLQGRADQLSPVEALALYYDFKELTPIGRRGDEVIRRLAERLAAVDLTDQAADLLQHQVDRRLDGASRAQVAARLAMLHLSGKRADRALAVLRSTRMPDLPTGLRNQRTLLEARALSDLKRHDAALETIEGMQGRDAQRLRADVLWAAERWQEAGEALERLLEGIERTFQATLDGDRQDILRASIAYSLADDKLGLERLRSRFAAVMANGPDAHAFDIVTSPRVERAGEIREVTRAIAGLDTLTRFLDELRQRPVEASPQTPAQPSQGPQSQGPAAQQVATR
jgi:tetratricopeptide (TPR) repeat protein